MLFSVLPVQNFAFVSNLERLLSGIERLVSSKYLLQLQQLRRVVHDKDTGSARSQHAAFDLAETETIQSAYCL